MVSTAISMRLLLACVFSWSLLVSLCCAATPDDSKGVIAIYGIVSEISDSQGANTLIVSCGSELWEISFTDKENLPETGRAIVILAVRAPDNTLVGIAYNYL